MPLTNLEHYLLQVRDMDETIEWYERVLGMRSGPHPDFKFPAAWLYVGDQPVLHVAEGGAKVSENRLRYLGQQSTALAGSGVVDHVAFHASKPREMIEHFEAEGIEFTRRQVDDQGQLQLFLIDPNGVKVEVNFSADEARADGVYADLSATELS